ncbi:Eco29kI family restriction endonuclease [Geodermatophilus sp. SYSU D01119]
MTSSTPSRPDVDFRLSITEALKEQLAAAIATCTPTPLDPAALTTLRASGGVYELYLRNARVYVGKADRSLADRLENHYWKIRGRRNINVADVNFVCAYVLEDLAATAPEELLIKKYAGSAGLWNTNGFGNKDPGRQRDTSRVKPGHFDALYPINLDWPCAIPRGNHTAAQILEWLKRELPYNLRYERRDSGNGDRHHVDLEDTHVQLHESIETAAEIFSVLCAALPAGWQVTGLPGYVILYRERRTYPDALMTWHST